MQVPGEAGDEAQRVPLVSGGPHPADYHLGLCSAGGVESHPTITREWDGLMGTSSPL